MKDSPRVNETSTCNGTRCVRVNGVWTNVLNSAGDFYTSSRELQMSSETKSVFFFFFFVFFCFFVFVFFFVFSFC